MMIKKTTYLFLIACLTIICLLPSCTDDPCENIDAPICPAPASVGVNSFSGDADISFLEFVWNSVAGVDSTGYEFEVLVNDISVETGSGQDTTFFIQLPLNIDDDVLFKVRSSCSNECRTSASNWTSITLRHKNGGATVDPIFLGKSMESVCDVIQGDCDYIHFPDGVLDNCDGTVKPLALAFSRRIYFERQVVCDCLNAFPGGFCNGVLNIEDCLTTRYLKRDYEFCP